MATWDDSNSDPVEDLKRAIDIVRKDTGLNKPCCFGKYNKKEINCKIKACGEWYFSCKEKIKK